MTTAARRSYFRRNVGDPGDGNSPGLDVFTDDEIDDIYTEIVDDPSVPSSHQIENIIRIKAVIIGFDWLRSDAVKQIDYMQNDSRVEADAIPVNLQKLQNDWINKLNAEISAIDGPAFGSGVTRRIPSRRKSYPDA